jgi:NAD(P)-dependent dehydrogenase (short-subunit alcohol dehydrogenase family)
MRRQGKVAVVTGAGFGEGIARRFAEEGCKIAVNDINRDGGERVAGVSFAHLTNNRAPDPWHSERLDTRASSMLVCASSRAASCSGSSPVPEAAASS